MGEVEEELHWDPTLVQREISDPAWNWGNGSSGPRATLHCGRSRRAGCLNSGVQDQPGQHGEASSLPKTNKQTKICQAWWWAPVVPATRVEDSLDPGGQGYMNAIKLPCPIHQKLEMRLVDSPPSSAMMRQGLTLLPHLECSSVIIAYCSLDFLGSRDPSTLSIPSSWDYHHVHPHSLRSCCSESKDASGNPSPRSTGRRSQIHWSSGL
ncbi:hypothetical protein AAY473_022213 [Plecturocebus cupreus]